eukprot:gene29736-biopygen4362
MRCFVDTAGNCIVKCFFATCDNHAPACIGRLAEPGGDSWDAGALHVNSRYIDIDACLEMKQAVDVWLDPERKDVNTLSVRSPMGKRIVVYTPTISAGIDFSTEHFDRMYLYLCPGSTGPMGALQMTGRVRHLVDTDVRTLVAKNMRVAREATRQHLTHVDLYQWLRWMDGFSTCDDVKHVQAIDGGEEHTLQELSGGALAPLCATVAPPTLKMTVESYFLAEIHNASFDYLSCFADLVEPAGHRVDLGTSYAAVSAARVIAPGEGDVEATSEFLLRVLKAQEQMDALTGSAPVAVPAPGTVAAPVAVPGTNILSNPDVPTAMRRKDLMDAIEQRVMANDASEDDKFILYLNRYCSAWGVDRVDEEFLMENKPGAVGSPKARLMSRLLCPILRPVRGADVHTTEHSGLLKIVLIEETLAALGFSSPFDTETVIPNLMTVFDTKLKGTQMEGLVATNESMRKMFVDTYKVVDNGMHGLEKMNLTGNLNANRIKLGDKWTLSGVGDKHGNDDWLRLFNKDGTGYYGGLAAGRLWSGGATQLNGPTSTRDINAKGNVNVTGAVNVKGADAKLCIDGGVTCSIAAADWAFACGHPETLDWLEARGYNMDPKVEQIEHPDPLVELIESVGPWLKETFPYWDMPDFTPKVNGEAIANRPTCPLQLAEMAEVGDHIAVKAKSGYWHHGIFVGRVEKGPYMVIDVYGDDKALSTICNRTLTAFTNGGTDYAIIPYDETISKEHSALIALHLQQTAEKQRWHYNAISNNCEHFATLCRCGRCAFP